MESSWFKKSLSKGLRTKEEQEFAVEDEINVGKGKETETLNAFHIISLSEGFDLSPLFEEKKRSGQDEEFQRQEKRFLRQVAGASEWEEGKLGIAADIFAVTPSFLVVEVKKSSGDTLEYNQFCSKELRPALKDIVWTSTTGNTVPA
ncbi:UNVERIFIED_CONTAM: CBL-interacting serine/threonine-protein kinase [Sesamum calycinum]|uniref:CBL-interacting serine/threonine-protein kinase n=1 Tax=Sesamum calycinum TaxID=2727403 RepID=A0AAW2JF72_9LAMI